MTRRLALAALVTALSSACTFEPGGGFATVESAQLSLFFEPGAARDLGDDRVLTDLGYHVAVEELRLGVSAVVLEELSGGSGGGGGVFDPADPPEGYSLCHGGHCHADDGSLVSYEEIQAQLSGGSAVGYSALLTLPLEEEVGLLDDPQIPLTTFEPSAELPQSTIARASLKLTSLALEATVTEGDLGGGALTLRAELDVEGEISLTANRLIDRESPEAIALLVDLIVDGTLFDDLDFAALAAGAAELDLVDEDEPAALTLRRSLLGSALTVSF